MIIDANIDKETYGELIYKHLLDMEISYKIEEQIIPRCVTWERTNEEVALSTSNQVCM